MRKLLIVLSVLAIVIPVVIIVQSFVGATWIKVSDYFWMVFIYIILLAIYLNEKRKGSSQKEE